MGKFDRVQQWQVERQGVYRPSASHPIHGSAIMERTLPPSALDIDSLDALTANIGEIRSGTIYVGNAAQARVIMGDAADGILAMLPTGQTYFALSNTVGSLSVGVRTDGANGGWAFAVRDGALAMHGDAIIDGTITTSKLVLPGAMSSVLLTSDYIFAGVGNPTVINGNATGTYFAKSGLCGLYEGVTRWLADSVSGNILTHKAGADAATNYVLIGGGGITIANDYDATYAAGAIPAAVLAFRACYPGGGNTEVGFYQVAAGRLALRSLNNDTGNPMLTLESYERGETLELSPAQMRIGSSYDSYYLSLGGWSQYGADLVSSGEVTIRQENGQTLLGVSADAVSVYGGGLRFATRTGYSWPVLPETPTADEMRIEPDPENERFLGWTGTKWVSFDTTDV